MWITLADVVVTGIVVPILVAAIASGAGIIALWRSIRAQERSTIIEGWDELTSQLRAEMSDLRAESAQQRREIDECNRDRAALHQEIGRLEGKIEGQQRELDRLRDRP